MQFVSLKKLNGLIVQEMLSLGFFVSRKSPALRLKIAENNYIEFWFTKFN